MLSCVAAETAIRWNPVQREATVLDGMRVVSFCHYLQGPAAAQYLADMGADVIKVEPPRRRLRAPLGRRQDLRRRASRRSISAANRNKRSARGRPQAPGRARPVIERPARATPTCVMENFRPGVMDRLGLGYEHVKAIKPDIIYASATGFGRVRADGRAARARTS